jgi:NACalpha-BTF3-like transcription factor
MTINKIENKLDDKFLSRGEKRTRKTLENFSFDKINGINHVKFKKSKNVNFSISQPEVFQSRTNNSFLIFGEAKIEN